MSVLECANQVSIWPVLVFCVCFAWLIFRVAKRNGFGLKEAVLAAVGLKKFERNLAINVLLVVTLLLPLTMWLWLIVECSYDV